MESFIEQVNHIVWGIPALVMIIGVGIYLCVQTHFVQIRCFPEAFRAFLRNFKKRDNSRGISPYQALCTALAATVGTGNIAGVAGAITIGGPGAIFWMWVCAFLGMVTKFAEATLAVRYRQKDSSGEWVGGPMYMIKKRMPGNSWLAILYCIFGIVAAFGVGNATQINAVIGCVNSVICYLGGHTNKCVDVLMGVVLSLLVLRVLLGGAKRIGMIAERLIPFAAAAYLFLCCAVLIGRFQLIPAAFSSIIKGAFTPKAVTGGALGSVFAVLRIGASRGVFTNEAGMGTASIAHASSDVNHPVEQGFMGMLEVFLDTIVICTMTALVILCSGIDIPYGSDIGANLTTNAFCSVLGDWTCVPLAVFLCCFAIGTVLGWGLYGTRCAQYVLGDKSGKYFVWIQAVITAASALLGTGVIWMLAEIFNGLMAIPNLIVIAYLAPELKPLIMQYQLDKRYKEMVKYKKCNDREE